jgi:hypothetical protein
VTCSLLALPPLRLDECSSYLVIQGGFAAEDTAWSCAVDERDGSDPGASRAVGTHVADGLDVLLDDRGGGSPLAGLCGGPAKEGSVAHPFDG